MGRDWRTPEEEADDERQEGRIILIMQLWGVMSVLGFIFFVIRFFE